MIEELKMYGYKCDHCQVEYENGDGYKYWRDKEDLMEWLNSDEWWKTIDGNWYCGNCYTLDETTEEYIVQSIRD